MTADHTLHCPVTDRPNKARFSWTDHGLPGSFNSCPECRPDGPRSTAQMLRELEEKLAAEDEVSPDPWEPDDDLTAEERHRRFLSTLSAMERRID